MRALSALGLALLFYAATPHVHRSAHGAEPAASRPRAVAQALPADANATYRTEDARDAATPNATRNAHGAQRVPATLSSDDAHESHRLTQTGDGHPCTLCRNGVHRAATHVAPTAVRLAPTAAARLEAPRLEAWPARPLARRHAARAPPIA
ncbi:MAG: hypothetical protein R3F35_14730 [Myxococcota bacterium]